MAEYLADTEGDYAGAAGILAELGAGGIELANGYTTAAELSSASYTRESQRAAEDLQPLAARSEDRLARAILANSDAQCAPSGNMNL
jgi:hypothetical protein